MWYIYTMEYCSAIERNKIGSYVVMGSEVKSERVNQISYINPYMWNLEKCYWWTYLQGRNRDTDMENGLTDTRCGGESGVNWESSIDMYTLLCVKQVANGKPSAQSSVMT